MLYTIRKHPIAFLHCLSWVGMGACMAYVMRYETEGYYEAQFADVCVTLFAVFLALIPLTLLIGLIVKLVRRQPVSAKKEKAFLHMAAKRFESTRPGFGRYYLPAVLAAVLPIAAFFSVVLVDNYVAAVLFAAIGLSVWLCYVCYCWPERRLLKVRDTACHFHIQQAPGMAEKLCEQGDVHGIPQKLWAGRQDHLYNMLLRAGAIDERSTITAYRFSAAEAAAQLGVETENFSAEEAVWVPLKPLLSLTDGKSNAAIRGLFVYDLGRIADLQYESTADRLPEEYPCSSREKRLMPDMDAFLRDSRRGLRLLSPTAEDDGDTLYQGCMLLMEGAQIADIKWDQFEDLSPEADRELFLSETEKQTFWRLLLEDAFAYEICSLTYLDERRQIAIEIWTEPEESSGKQVSNEAKPFVMDDGIGYLLLVSHEGIKWHWLHTRPYGA